MPQLRTAGFTLLELLVVVALIGVMISTVVLSIGDGGRQKQMENEARRLASVVKLARDEAILMSDELAMVIGDDYYDFQRFGEKKWESLTDDRILNRHALPDALELVLEMETFAYTPKRKKSKPESEKNILNEDDDRLVRVYFLSSGEVQPFILYIRDQNLPDSSRFKVEVDQEGEVSWHGPLDAADS